MTTIDLMSKRAARREAAGGAVFLRVDDGEPIELPVELPIDVFDPILDAKLDDVVFQVLAMSKNPEDAEKHGRNLLLGHPEIVEQLVGVGKACTLRLLGEDGYARFVGSRPSPQDFWELLKGVWESYGAGLGEAFASLAPATGAVTTSTPTSSGSTESTSPPADELVASASAGS